MKKIAFFIFSMIILAGFNMPLNAQILDNPPQDVVQFDNDLLDTKPIPYPATRQADIMWSKRI